jgi:hypothetical protein
MDAQLASEVNVAIGKHDFYIRRVTEILGYLRRDLDIPEELLLAQDEPTKLDKFLDHLAARLLNVAKVPDHIWMSPGRYAFENGYMKPGKATWLEALLRGLQQSRAFFESFETRRRQEDRAMNYNINVSHTIGPVNVLSQLDHVTQAVENARTVSEGDREKLNALLQELKAALADTPPEHHEEAAAVVEEAEGLVKAISRTKPDKSLINIKGSGLVEAAKALRSVVPMAIQIATQIATFAGQMFS